MLSLFPEILFLAPFSALLLRLALAFVFAYAAWTHVSRGEMLVRALGVAEIAVAVALFTGSWTQAGALAGIVVAALWLFSPSWSTYARGTVLLSLAICVSLLVTGAGAFAFDMPL